MSAFATTLRPLGMGELFDRAIRLYRQNFLKFISVIALMQVPLAIFTLIVSIYTSDSVVAAIPNPSEITPGTNPFELLGTDYYIGLAAGILVSLAELILVSGVASAALTRMVADSYLGVSLDTIGAYRAVGDRWGPLVRAIFLFIVSFILIFAWIIVPCAGWLTGPGMLLVLTVMILPLLAPVVVMENFGARKSIRRAWELVRGRFWWIFGFILLLFVFNWVVVGGPSLLAGYLINLLIPESLAGNADALYNLQLTVQTLVSLVFQLLYLPLQLTCVTLLYLDLRVRNEGLDLLLNTNEDSPVEMPVRDLIAATTTLPTSSPISGREIINFVLLTLLVLGLYFVVVVVFAGLFTVLFSGGL